MTSIFNMPREIATLRADVMRQSFELKQLRESVEAIVAEKASQPQTCSGDQQTLYCSFCAKSQHDVTKLIAGPACFICNECIALCVGICMGAEEDKK